MNESAGDGSTSHEGTRITFIGGGNMARSLIGGMHRARAGFEVTVSEPNAQLAQALTRDFGVACIADNASAARGAQVWLLAVKPQVMKAVCTALREVAQGERPLVICIAAGIRIDQIDRWLGGGQAIVRCMPNTPALIGAGATGLCANARVDAAQKQLAETILGAAGINAWIADEKWMDTVTALSGSGPAYFFLLVEALEQAAVAQGLPRDVARALATQTCLGAGRMLSEDGEAPEQLRQRVTSPGGTTHAAIQAFIDGGLRELVANAVAAATARGMQMSAAMDD